MKEKMAIFTAFMTIFSFLSPLAKAYEIGEKQVSLISEEEDTSEYENEVSYIFPEEILSVMAGTDSYVTGVRDNNSFDIPCRNAILVEENSGRMLYEKGCDAQVPMASITKIMTMLLVLEALESGKINIDDIVPVSIHSYEMGGSQIWLEPGERMTVHEMLKAVAVSSANDAAVALAEYVGGSEETFCSMMNEKAKSLGMEHTHFVNACGLDIDGHYSSARDISIMARELMKHSKIYEYTSIWMDYLRGGQTQLVNTNKLLRSYSGITGLKTGTTSKAGVCICATAQRNGLSLIAVVLGADSSQERFKAARMLLDFGFSNFETKDFPRTPDLPNKVPVKMGTQQMAEISCTLPEKLLFTKGATTQLTYKIDMPDYITAPMSRGSKLGSLSLYTSTEKIGEYNIILTEDISKIDFAKALSILTNKVATM